MLSILIPYRDRLNHLQLLLNWLLDSHWTGFNVEEIEIVIVEFDRTPTIKNFIGEYQIDSIKYFFLQCNGVFHKTKVLNFALQNSIGNVILPLDIDLIPRQLVLKHQYRAAALTDHNVVGGYRLMTEYHENLFENILENTLVCALAPEDSLSCLHKQLVAGERLVIAPMFHRKLIEQIGGWDEGYIGWGAEDQDILERAEKFGATIMRCPAFVYYHINHARENLWNEEYYVVLNRTRYNRERRNDEYLR